VIAVSKLAVIIFVMNVFMQKRSLFWLSLGIQIVAAADEVVDSIDREELAKCLSLNSDPEDEESQVNRWVHFYGLSFFLVKFYPLFLMLIF
jgi:hypothetical protein